MKKIKKFLDGLTVLFDGDIDKYETNISPSNSEFARVQAVNNSRSKRILELQREVEFLNAKYPQYSFYCEGPLAKYPQYSFYREGPLIKELNGADIRNTQGHAKNDGDSYLRKN